MCVYVCACACVRMYVCICNVICVGGEYAQVSPAVSDSAPEQFRVIHVTPISSTIDAHELCSYGWETENSSNRLNPHLICRKGMKFGAAHVASEAKAPKPIAEFLSTYL